MSFTYFSLCSFFILGIVGTKDYRKPEWVTHMEELQEALQGKNNVVNLECMSKSSERYELSIDSLDMPNVISPEAGNDSFFDYAEFASTHKNDLNDSSSRYLSNVTSNNCELSEGHSVTSVSSEPISKQKPKQGFIESAMADYLNSHRHSLSSVMELIDMKERDVMQKNDINQSLEISDPIEYSSTDDLQLKGESQNFDDMENVYVIHNSSHPYEEMNYYILSPIDENTEPSMSGSSKDSNESDKKQNNFSHSRIFSNSCVHISSNVIDIVPDNEKSQTFPRSKDSGALRRQQKYGCYYDKTIYPLEPRELDPSTFFQLHNADSQEELQEFLLLESECMSDSKGRGLATAFKFSDDDVSIPEGSSKAHPGLGKLTIINFLFYCLMFYFTNYD